MARIWFMCPMCDKIFAKDFLVTEDFMASNISDIENVVRFYIGAHYTEHFKEAKNNITENLRPIEDFISPNDNMGGITENEL